MNTEGVSLDLRSAYPWGKEVEMTRDPKIDPQPGDVIRWTDDPLGGKTYVAIVTGRYAHTMSWVDVNPNGYPDSETANVYVVWQKHAGIQSGTVLFVAPPTDGKG